MNDKRREQLTKKVTDLIGEVLGAMKKEKSIIHAVKTYVTPEDNNTLSNAEIFEYIRERKAGRTQKVGIIWGTIDNSTIRIGWSKCNQKAGDKFDFTEGLKLAKNRAYGVDKSPTKIPDRNRSQMRDFISRSVKYFKGATSLHAAV